MKKLLTILTLALALCLLCGTALAVEHHSSGVDLNYNDVPGPDSLDITLGSPVEIEGNLFTPVGLSKTVLPKESSAWVTSLNYVHGTDVPCVAPTGIVFSVLYDDGDGNLYTRAYNIQKADGHKIWDHEWGAPIVKDPFTCELQETCDCCGAVKGTGVYDHTWQDVVVKEATCQEKGQVKHVCKVCGVDEGIIYDGMGGHHSFKLHITPPQCDPETMLVVPGEAYVKCEYCNTYVEVSYIDTWLTMGDKIADSETTTDILAATEYGIDEARYQELCGEEVSAHDWTGWHEIDNDCEHPGYRIRYCNRCGHDESTMYPAGDPRNFPKTPNWEIVVLNEKGYTCAAEFGEDYIIRCTYCKGKAAGHKITKLGTPVGPDANGTTYTATENLVGTLKDNTYLRKEYTVDGSDGSQTVLVHLESHVYKEEPAYLLENDAGDEQATCIDAGYKYYRCVNADPTLTTATTTDHYPLRVVAAPATGHNFGPWIMMEAPETKADGTEVPGRWVRVCTNTYCLDRLGIDHQQEELKQMLKPCKTEADHDWQPVTLEAFTCTKDGKTAEQCSKCLKIKDGSEKVVPAHHIWDAGKVLTAPNCTEEGVLILTCTVCKNVKNEVIPALGHDPKDVEEVPATCKDTGITAGKICDRCGIELEGFEVIPVTDEHDYVEEIVTEPTCSAEGKKLFTCSVCGKTYTEAIEKIAHTPVDVEEVPATCKTEGVAAGKECSVCGEKLEGFEVLPVDETAHVWETETVKEPTCTKAGLDIRTCSVCGKVEKDEIAALGHTWDEGVVSKEATKDEKGDMTYTCTECGETKVEEGVVEYVVTADPKYEVTELAYDGQVVTGKLVHVEDTLESPVLTVRVTFFLAGNYYMATIGEVEADGTFAVEGVGPIEYISVQANGNSSVNPTEVNVLGANDLEVK